MQIYVSKNGQRYGPYSLEELRREVRSNLFQPGHFASCDNGHSWTPISALPGVGPLVYAIGIDAEKNLLVIRYRGHVGASDVAHCADEIPGALVDLPSGFRLLVDFTALESMEVGCAPHLRHIMKLCNAKNVSTVVRVIPDPRRDIGLQIMSSFHYGPDVRIQTCSSLEEATASLAMQNGDGETHVLA